MAKKSKSDKKLPPWMKKDGEGSDKKIVAKSPKAKANAKRRMGK